MRPITREEALQYDRDALLADTQKRGNNIKIFEEAIAKEKDGIKQDLNIISQIDKDHPDVKQLEENIEKRKVNIKTFDEAIKNEQQEIERDLEMIKIIDANQ